MPKCAGESCKAGDTPVNAAVTFLILFSGVHVLLFSHAICVDVKCSSLLWQVFVHVIKRIQKL